MTDITPEKRAELRAETIAGKRSHEARGLVSTVTVLSDTLLSILDALDEKERELASAWDAGHSAGFTQCARGVDDDLADTFYGKKTNPHKAKP